MRIKIKAISAYTPENEINNQELAGMIQYNGAGVSSMMVERTLGTKKRRFAAQHEQVSDLAVKAAQPILEQFSKEKIDFLIFASACSDLIEPATSNIIQRKLGVKCPCIDLKNACNSAVSGIHIASGMIQAGIYENVLILSGEKLSDSIQFSPDSVDQLKLNFPSYSFGDAGTAILLGKSEDESGFYYQNFMNAGEHWELCTIKGGGSMFPHDISKNYFEGQTTELRKVILDKATKFVNACMKEANWSPDELDHLFTHQVSPQTFIDVTSSTGIDINKCINIFDEYGNTAACSIPLSVWRAEQEGRLKKGDKIAIIGLAAGISISLQLAIW
ncbi:MAG: ketoacyl-ACP synthase III [Saprospiraceae bacterium]|nr:ketoacyl-ACP synthase III [Saprospiraceae bacterium]